MGQDEKQTEIQYVVWKSEMSVRSKAIDVQHRQEVIAELSRSKDYHALLHFLRDWWLGHIQGIDRLYISYVEKLDL